LENFDVGENLDAVFRAICLHRRAKQVTIACAEYFGLSVNRSCHHPVVIRIGEHDLRLVAVGGFTMRAAVWSDCT
jgi:hypothetical protein